MSAESKSLLSRDDIRIEYRADGTATVNGAPVPVERDQDVRDAAYLAAVGLVAAAGMTGPVVATSVEADGAAYPVTLYPAGVALAAEAESALSRVRRAWYHPTLSLSWMAAAACACVLLSVLATVLLRDDDSPVVRLSVDTESEVGHSAAARAGRALAALPDVATPLHAAAKPTASPVAGQSHPTKAKSTTGLSSQLTNTVPTPAPGPKPKPRSVDPQPAAVTNLTLTLIGGDQSGSGIAYLASISTSTKAPISLTYSYAGSHGRAPVTRSVPLSGSTNYVLADLIPAQPYCGGALTMTVSTKPTASNGTVTATAPSGC